MPDVLVSVLATILAFFSAAISSFAGGGYSLMFFPILLHFVSGTYAAHLGVAKLGGLAITVMSGQVHYRRNRLDPNLLFMLMIWGGVGTAIGTYLMQYHFNESLFRGLLGASLLVAAFYLVIKTEVGHERGSRRKITKLVLLEIALFALGVGVLNGLFGGTGIFTALYLVFVFKVSFRKAIAYTMLSYIFINLAQASYLMATESVNIPYAVLVAIAAGAGGWAGTHLQYMKGSEWIKSVAIAIMVFLGISNLVG